VLTSSRIHKPESKTHFCRSETNISVLLRYNLKVMNLEELTQKMHALVESKGWYASDSVKQQTPRNLAISLVLEAAEVLELFQWQANCQDQKALAGELADTMLYLLQLASVSGIDLEQSVLDKIAQNQTRLWPEHQQKEPAE